MAIAHLLEEYACEKEKCGRRTLGAHCGGFNGRLMFLR